MNATILEIVGKKRKDFTISFSFEKNGSETSEQYKFSGDRVWDEFEEFYLNNIDKFEKTISLVITNRHHDLVYLSKFKNIKKLWIHGSGIQLKFPDMRDFNHLEEIHINGQGKEPLYETLTTAPNLRELYLGDWSIPTPVKISSFKEILKCKGLTKLYLSHIRIQEGSIRELASLVSLKELTLPQNISVEDLAFLSVKLPGVSSMEFRAYQECENFRVNVNVKVNGKRMPYLDKGRDKEKLEKYEVEFERLKKSFQTD